KTAIPIPPPPTTLLHRLATLDTTLSHHLYTLTHPFLPYPLLKLLEISGDGFLFFPLLISLLLYPYPTPTTTPLYPLIYNLLIGGIIDLILIGLLKHRFRRPRPLYNKNMSIAFAVDQFSFPSGHSSRVFFVATMLCNNYGVRDFMECNKMGGFLGDHFVGIVWGWAVLTSISRVLLGRHFVCDVVVGMCLGVLNGVFVFRVFNWENLVGLLMR
ncbi:hypothetical protein Leryth_026371, partial [Lithospermum erythrorhizon]